MGSAQLVVGFVRGERRRRGVARRSSRRSRPIGENSDYQTSTPSPRLIRARRILTKRRRGAGAVPFAARRGAATTSRPPLLVATACLALAAAASATALTRTCCVSAAPWARAARVARPAAGPASCVGGRVDDVVLGSALRGRESAVFQSGAFALAAARQACAQGCQSLFARAGLPWHDPISALPVSLLPCITGTTFWTSMHTGTLWYLKPYDFQAPGLPTTPSTHIDPE